MDVRLVWYGNRRQGAVLPYPRRFWRTDPDSSDVGIGIPHRILLPPGAGASVSFFGSNPSGNITETVEEHFGKTGGVVITFLYFFAICPLLWIYGVTITNTFMTFWENQLGFAPLNRGFVALFLLLLMAFVIWFGKDLMVKVMSYGMAVYRQPRC